MSLKIDLQETLKRYKAEKEENEKEVADIQDEIKNDELLLTRAEKGLFQKGETELTDEESEDLQYEILAMKDILVWYKSKLERNIMDIHLAQAKLETLNSIKPR